LGVSITTLCKQTDPYMQSSFISWTFCVDVKDGRTVVELAKVLSVYRTDFLYQRHKMLKLPLTNPSYNKDFLDGVHVTYVVKQA